MSNLTLLSTPFGAWSYPPQTQTTVTMGVFDGVHLGHQTLLRETIRLAKEEHCTPLVLTFDPHPAACLSPDNAPKLLMTPEERAARLQKSGIENVLFAHFDAAFASLTAEAFVTEILLGKLSATHIVIGDDFRFGKGRTGDATYLRECGLAVHTIAPVIIGTVPARSTTIRAALETSNLTLANVLLGTPYTLSGVVVRGKQLGRTIGFPTANLQTDPRVLIPAAGVYAGLVNIDGTTYRTAISIGVNPTIGDNLPTTVEAYVLDFESDLYGKSLVLTFTKHLRPMVKFNGLDALKGQIAEDVSRVREEAKREI
jgi:riboflavin kinase / FMN adenylyltransferase